MLHKITLQPGLDKQSSDTGAEGKWVNSDYVRFRYGYPEKIGGWQQLVSTYLVGAGRDQHTWVDLAGNKYAAIGTNKCLYIYFEGSIYDITPLDTTRQQTGSTFGFDGTTTVTLTTTTHGAEVGDIILLSSVTGVTALGIGFTDTDFEGKLFEVTAVPTSTSMEITMGSAATGTASGGSTTVDFYYVVGPVKQTYGYGWGTNTFGGQNNPVTSNTLNGALLNDAFGTGGVGTDITLTDTTGFSSSGKIKVDSELITYTGITGNDLTGITRGTNGTATAAHSNGATVYDATNWVGWGSASTSSNIVIEPGQWRLLNYGENLIALIHNKRIFQWEPSIPNLTVRAVAVSGTEVPTESRDLVLSTPDRHLVAIGTELNLQSGDQDDMFVRWSDQNSTTSLTPTKNNTAGSQKLSDGSKLMGGIVGKTAVYLWSDTAMYTMKFIGPPLTFGFQQVGTNCGMSSQHAAAEVDGIAYWMGPTGFYRFNGGRVELMQCLVEDYVFEDINTNSNQQIHVAVNALFGEITWFYPSSGSDYVDRSVTYNYLDSTPDRLIWTTSSLARSTWTIEGVFSKPYATQFDTGLTPTVPTITGVSNGASYYWEHETGNNELLFNGTKNAIAAFIESGDYDISRDEGIQGQGEFMMRISRIIPDFGAQTGDAKVYLNSKSFPNSAAISTSYNVTTATTQVNTRKRARQIAIKVGNISTDQTWRMGTFRLDIHAGGRR